MLLDEIAKYLADNSIGTVGTNIFKGHLPATPNTATSIFEEPGSGPSFTFGLAPAYETPHLQIVCRSSEYKAARVKAETIYRLLDGVAGVTLKPAATDTGALYLRIEPLQVPFGLGNDENARALVSCNYRVMKELST
jgi:hypothetical protein